MARTASQQHLQRFSRHAGSAIIAIAMLVLTGWLLKVPFLKSLHPQFVAMNPLTAVLFILGSVALKRLATRPGRGRPLLEWVFASALLLGGTAKLAQYFFGFQLGLDQFLFGGRITPAGFSTNEVAPNTAFNFLLCGAGLLLLDFETRRGYRPAQVCFLLSALVALLALIGYAYRVLPLYRIGSAIPMALNTAIAFELFSLAALAARPDRGIMRVVTSNTTGGAMVRRLLPAAMVIPFVLGAVRLFGERGGYLEAEFGPPLFAVANIVIFTTLIWVNARLLFVAEREQERAERRLAAQYAVTRALAEYPADATAKALETFGAALGWQFGVLWIVEEKSDSLRCRKTWQAPDAGAAYCDEATRQQVFTRGTDLPGRVWASGEPEWIADVVKERRFARSQPAAKAGLHGAFAFPLRFGDTVFGVMEFFSRDIEPPDVSLLQTAGAVGSQIGQFIERRRSEEQLKQTSAELERSNTELQQFAYVASHDLSEPLRMVVSYLQLLTDRSRGQLDKESLEFIGYAVDGAQRMQGLINDLLAYARVGTRGRPLEPTSCEAVLLAALTNLKVALEESGASIEHDALPMVNGDRVQLTQVFQNLVGNAIKFRGAAPLRIRIRAERKGAEWVFLVKDNGIGIDAKNFERIFVLFQRLHTRQEYAGTGMGLAICKKIIERHGGRIWVESRVGDGSVFFFTLPAMNGP